MTVDRMLLRIVGILILSVTLLTWLHSIYWLWALAFIGANLFQSSITGFCPLAIILKKIGIKSGQAF
ncbi:MAG: DUF2892 domain-containing protein [Deltaproteobacteria bacterium]|nr:DUF2892 domain-containing protein [Deltaproteobacteria bacterium]